ncbi:transposable element Tcb2 transposase [Trichonephila clavipes]|nr:transposable element Tcb2 transposase [Trichonephila clavipes]
MGLQFLFMDVSCMRFSRQTLGSSYLTTSNDSGASIGAARRMGAMPQKLIDTLILSMGRRCETCLAVREIISSSKDRMFLAGHPSQGGFGLQSHCVPCYFFNQASFYTSDFSFITTEQHYGCNQEHFPSRAYRTTKCFSDFIDSCVKMGHLLPVLMEEVDRGLYGKHTWKKSSWTVGTKHPE